MNTDNARNAGPRGRDEVRNILGARIRSEDQPASDPAAAETPLACPHKRVIAVSVALDVVLLHHRAPEFHLVRQELALHVRAAELHRDLHSMCPLMAGSRSVSASAVLKRSMMARGVRPAVNEPHQA